MNDSTGTMPSRWYTTRKFQQWVLGIAAVVLLVEAGLAIFKKEGDFNCHLAFGQHFLDKTPYISHGNYYPLGRLALDALPASLNYYVARGLCLALALGGLAVSVVWWLRMSDSVRKIEPALKFALVAMSCGMMLPLLLRDLDECGLQLMLLFLLSAGGYAMFRGKPGLSGFCLALATTYKATPALFLPLLIWKRQWKAAGAMAAFIVAFNLLPAVHLGWDATVAANGQWFERSQFIMANMPDAYPSVPIDVEAPKPQNMSLTALLARWVETYPEGHSLYQDHPAFVQLGSLPPEQAKQVVRGLILLIGAFIALSFRRSWRTSAGSTALPHEWAVACLFCALMSPLCWKQHLVLGLPCVLLAGRDILAAADVPRWRKFALAAATAVMLLCRNDLVGRELGLVLMSYKLDTMALLLLAWMAAQPLIGAVAERRETEHCEPSHVPQARAA